MRKTIILAMCCNQEFYEKQERVLREQSYAKDIIEGKYPNIEYWSYFASSDDKYHINKSMKHMYVPAGDDLYSTYEKTMKAFTLLENMGIEYDYILRTNCSTFINCQLLDRFIQEIPQEEIDNHTVFSPNIYSTSDASGPEPYDCYAVGNTMIIPRYWVRMLPTLDLDEYKQYDKTPGDDNKSIYHIDDNAIGFMINTFRQLAGQSKGDVWKSIHNNGNVPLETLVYKFEFHNYISTPVRQYTVADRTIEYDVLKFMQMNTKKILFDNYNNGAVYKLMTKKQTRKLTDFSKNLCICLSPEECACWQSDKERFNGELSEFIKFIAAQRIKNRPSSV